MTNKFAPIYRSLESSNYFLGSYITNGRRRVKLIAIPMAMTRTPVIPYLHLIIIFCHAFSLYKTVIKICLEYTYSVENN